MGVPASAGVSASGRSPYFPYDKANGVIQGTIGAVAPTKPFAFLGPMNLFLWGEFTTSLVVAANSLTATVGAAGAIAAGVSIKSTLVPYGTTASAINGTPAVTLVLPTYTYSGRVRTGVASVFNLLDTSLLLGSTVSGIGVASGQTVTAIATASIAPSLGVPQSPRGTVTLSAVATAQQDDNKIDSPYEFALHRTGALTNGTDTAAVFTSAAIGLTGVVQLERSFDGGQTWLVCNIGGSGALAQWNPATPVSISFGEPEQYVLYRLNCTALTPSTGTALKFRVSETGQAARVLSIPTLS